ncbi:MAG: rhodanese-like domain-containing protein [Pseudomonadota bacterium]
MRPFLLAVFIGLGGALLAEPAVAASSEEHRARRPDLFEPTTGLRIARQRAPTPDDVPGAPRIDVHTVREMMLAGAVLLDVGAAAQSHYDELDGTWLVREPHESIPGATWLPETGRGWLSEEMRVYLSTHLERLTQGDRYRQLVVFCIADCWMSWNATQRITALGYRNVAWFAEGVDGWRDAGWGLQPTEPVPVNVD